MNIHFDLEGQTAPESTRGFYDPPENSSSTRKTERRRSMELGSRMHKSMMTTTKSNRASGLHTVSEEDLFYNKPMRSSIAHFNNFPMAQFTTEERELSRADVLAETEAKLNGLLDDKQSRRLSEPQRKRLSFHQDNKRMSLMMDDNQWKRPNSIVGLVNYHRPLSTIESSNQRKPLFISHLPFSSVVPQLKSNLLVSGLMRVNKRNRSDAYVFCEELNADIYICGSRDRNRALEGDHVAVKLIEVDQVMLEKHEKEEAKLARNNGVPVVRKPDEEDEKEIIFGGEEDVDLVTPKFCGVVVAILDRAQKQVFSGTLGLNRPSNKRVKNGNDDQRDNTQPRIIWFKPTDKRVPLIAIPVEQAPAGFIENSEAFENRLFLGSIKRWPITSLHPFGVLENELGLVDNIHVQVQAILADNNLTFSTHFPELTIPNDWIENEISQRRDLRSHRCVTIMDHGFLDNALSVVTLPDGGYEVGFHVADITAFVSPDSALDKEARSRSIDVYHTIIEKVPLWPVDLRQNYTDFAQGQDRLAFSLIWIINKQGKVQDTWYGKTVINSSCVLKPSDLQDIIDSPGDYDVEKDVMCLYKVAHSLRQARSDRAVSIQSPKLDIQYGEGTSQVSIQQSFDADIILAEFQILANTQVAQKISSHFPDHALLRSQAGPNERKMRDLIRYLNSLGYCIDPGHIQKSIDQIDDPDARAVIIALIMKTMSQEKYFCAGAFDINRYHHYSTDAPLYTHFTCPSRRYADVIVHRQLDAYLKNEPYFYLDPEMVQKAAQHCNVKTKAVENAHEQTQHLFLSYNLAKDGTTSHLEDAIVVGVQEGSFDVIVPGLGLERRIHTINLPLKTDTYSPSENMLHLVWIQGRPTVDGQVESNTDDLIELYESNDVADQVKGLSIKNRKRSTSIRAIEDAFLTQCTFPNECRQLIRPFDFIKVVISADPIRSPPLIRILAANPFITK